MNSFKKQHHIVAKCVSPGVRFAQIQILAPLLNSLIAHSLRESYLTSLYASFPHLQYLENNNSYFTGLLWQLNELICVKHLKLCLLSEKCLITSYYYYSSIGSSWNNTLLLTLNLRIMMTKNISFRSNQVPVTVLGTLTFNQQIFTDSLSFFNFVICFINLLLAKNNSIQ